MRDKAQSANNGNLKWYQSLGLGKASGYLPILEVYLHTYVLNENSHFEQFT